MAYAKRRKLMNGKYTYDSIDVTTKTGKNYNYVYCDYYIQDNILTVFRKETFKKRLL